jgi:hypothetical protein
MTLRKKLAEAEEVVNTLLSFGAAEQLVEEAYQREVKLREAVERAQHDKYRNLGKRVRSMLTSQRRNGYPMLRR